MQHADHNDVEQPVFPDYGIKYAQKAVGVTSYCADSLEKTSLMAFNDLEAA